MKRAIRIYNTTVAIVLCWVLSVGFMGCNDDNETSPSFTDNDVAYVPIEIALGGYNQDEDDPISRAAPPGSGSSTSGDPNTSDDNGYEETQNINTVRIISFRRKTSTEEDTSQTQDDEEGFVYDPYNDITLTELTDENGHNDDYLSGKSHKHRNIQPSHIR